MIYVKGTKCLSDLVSAARSGTKGTCSTRNYSIFNLYFSYLLWRPRFNMVANRLPGLTSTLDVRHGNRDSARATERLAGSVTRLVVRRNSSKIRSTSRPVHPCPFPILPTIPFLPLSPYHFQHHCFQTCHGVLPCKPGRRSVPN